MARNIALYPWFKVLQNLIFWQAIWFLYIQGKLGPAEAILIYVFYDLATMVLEVPSGYMSDRLGRRLTLLLSALAMVGGALMQVWVDSFAAFAACQLLIGASIAFASGTDSALLYESLAQDGKADQIERQEVRAWRYMFTSLAVSAALGGALFYINPALPYVATALAGGALFVVTLSFKEPDRSRQSEGGLSDVLATLRTCLRQPVLLWLLAFSMAMYTFSHLPFVFGQPFIVESLTHLGFAAEAPVVSGLVTAAMMGVSVLASLWAFDLRARIGLAGMLLVAFGVQVALVVALSLSNAAPIIALLFLRMVPSALSTPFITARIQPVLSDNGRATYLSLQSFAGRIVFAVALSISAANTSDVAEMPYADIQAILIWFTVAGLALFAALALTVRRAGVDPSPAEATP